MIVNYFADVTLSLYFPNPRLNEKANFDLKEPGHFFLLLPIEGFVRAGHQTELQLQFRPLGLSLHQCKSWVQVIMAQADSKEIIPQKFALTSVLL